ncbi:MAG: hypothetical protein ACRD5F_11575, partial [Candidatus Acidiferrales bacterium]
AAERALEARYEARLEREMERLREQSQRAVEEFKRSFPPPSDEQIERLLYPELSEFQVELGGRRFALRELPATVEKKFLRLVEQKLPALMAEVLAFDERLGDDAERGFTRLLARAASALDLIADACVLVLDPLGESGVTSEFVQQHASTARQLRILKAQLLLNGGRDFLSRLLPALRSPVATEGPVLRNPQEPEVPALRNRKQHERARNHEARTANDAPTAQVPGPAGAAASSLTPGSPPLSVGSSSSAARPAKLDDSSPWDNFL